MLGSPVQYVWLYQWLNCKYTINIIISIYINTRNDVCFLKLSMHHSNVLPITDMSQNVFLNKSNISWNLWNYWVTIVSHISLVHVYVVGKRDPYKSTIWLHPTSYDCGAIKIVEHQMKVFKLYILWCWSVSTDISCRHFGYRN